MSLVATSPAGVRFLPVTDIREDSFGLLIAYVVPGFLLILQLSIFSESLQAWLVPSPETAPTVAGFLFVTVASVGAGLTASTVRWLVLDTIHHCTGLAQPQWSFQNLHARAEAFQGIVQNHYRYYQFYGNTVVVVLCGTLVQRGPGAMMGLSPAPAMLVDLGLVGLFAIASRDALRKYYSRTRELLAPGSA